MAAFPACRHNLRWPPFSESHAHDRHGRKVHEMMAAYHDPPEGYLRLIEFLPNGTTVQVRTYSPYLDKSLTDGNNQFLLEVEPVREPDRAQ